MIYTNCLHNMSLLMESKNWLNMSINPCWSMDYEFIMGAWSTRPRWWRTSTWILLIIYRIWGRKLERNFYWRIDRYKWDRPTFSNLWQKLDECIWRLKWAKWHKQWIIIRTNTINCEHDNEVNTRMNKISDDNDEKSKMNKKYTKATITYKY